MKEYNRGVVRVNISNTRDSVSSGYPNNEKRVQKTTRSGVFFLRNSRCLIYLLNRKKRSKRRSKIIKSMLNKSRYSNLLHGCDQPHSQGLSSYRPWSARRGGTLKDPGNKVINEFEEVINRRSEHFT